MNIDKENNIVYIGGVAYYFVPVEQEKILICEIDGKKYYLGPEANKKMNWYEAKAWARDMGGVLMPREVALIAYKKNELRKHFRTDDAYWLDQEYGPSTTWVQFFSNGYQLTYSKTSAGYVRAIFVE